MNPLPPLLLVTCLAAAVAADGPAPKAYGPPMPPLQQRQPEVPPQPWIGCSLQRPDPTLAAQIPDLPPGVGLVVQSIAQDSPASAARLEANDIIWKFRDQWVINQAQLAVLLKNSKVGEEIRFGIFRAGKSLDVPLTIRAAPEGCEDGFIFDHGGNFTSPPIIVDKSHGARTASAKNSQGQATMTRQEDSYRVAIKDAAGKVLFEKDLPEGSRWTDIPQGWHRVVYALRRSLDNTEETALSPVRPPRQRVIRPQDEVPSPQPRPVQQ